MTTAQLGPRSSHHSPWPSIFRWTSRLLGIVFVLFLGVFALDVFEPGAAPLEMVGAFLMHMLPALVLLGLVGLAWSRPLVGAAAYMGFGVIYLLRFGGQFDWTVYLLLAGLPVAIGLLYLGDWTCRRALAGHPRV